MNLPPPPDGFRWVTTVQKLPSGEVKVFVYLAHPDRTENTSRRVRSCNPREESVENAATVLLWEYEADQIGAPPDRTDELNEQYRHLIVK